MGDQDFLVVLVDGDFLEFGWLLAANAFPWPKPHNVTSLAVVTNAINLSVMDGKDVVHTEIPIRLKFAFEPDFIVAYPLIFKRPESILVAPGQRNLFGRGSQHRPRTVDKKQGSLQGLLGVLDVRRPACYRDKKDDNTANPQSGQDGIAEPAEIFLLPAR